MDHVNVPTPENPQITLCLCGDVMIGRGIDQVLPYPAPPKLYERFMEDARGYIKLAERVNGPIPSPVEPGYIWGDALAELDRIQPDLRIINLETSITCSQTYWPDKGINYRAGPKNITALQTAQIDCCALANNHVLDWGHSGLLDTIRYLHQAQILFAGAGSTLEQAKAPAVLEPAGKGRVLFFSCGIADSGIPREWSAFNKNPGIYRITDYSQQHLEQITALIGRYRTTGDIVVFSVHWGGNWGYRIPEEQVQFAHRLIDQARVDLVHGHSSHHVKGLELYRGKLILYGCGDFLNDYEGIAGHEQYRGDLGLMYFVSLQPGTGQLIKLEMAPTRIKNFQLKRAGQEECQWLCALLNRESQIPNTSIIMGPAGTLRLESC